MNMLDRTKIYFKKAVKEVTAKASKPHKETMATQINAKAMSIHLFLGNTIYYSEYIFAHESKAKIKERMEGLRKMYYAWEQMQNKR